MNNLVSSRIECVRRIQRRIDGTIENLSSRGLGFEPKKQWMCVAEGRGDGKFTALAPEPVGEVATLLRRLIDRGDHGVFVGLTFLLACRQPMRGAWRREFPRAAPCFGQWRLFRW